MAFFGYCNITAAKDLYGDSVLSVKMRVFWRPKICKTLLMNTPKKEDYAKSVKMVNGEKIMRCVILPKPC